MTMTSDSDVMKYSPKNIIANLRALVTSRTTIAFIACIAVMAAVAFAFFYPDAAEGNVLRQHDIKQGFAIGKEAADFHEATGETTRWTGSLFSGMPTFQISPTYESSDLYSWITNLMGLGLPSPANLVFMMMAGFFILLMALKIKWPTALFGAVAYGFSTYFIIIIGAGHIWKFVTLAYIPPTIAGIVLCYRGRYLMGGALAALFAMMQIASNHVQMTYYFLFVVLGVMAVYLIEALRSHTMKRWGTATGVLAVAAILAVTANLPGLYNTYEYSKETMRGGHSELSRTEANPNATAGLDRDYITQYSYGTSETFSLLIPNVKGGASMKPEKGEHRMLTLASLPEAQDMIKKGTVAPPASQYLEYMSQYFGEPEGTNGPVYVGALIFALFVLGCIIVKGPWKWVLLALTVFSILLALGRNFMWFTDLMIDYMPMYSKFRTVESILVIAEFTMPLLAVMALDRILSTPRGDLRKLYMRPAAWAFGITAALCLIGAVAPGFYGSAISEGDRQVDAMIGAQLSQQGYDARTVAMFSLQNPEIYNAVETLRQGMVSADALRSLIFILLGGGIIALLFARKINATVAGIGMVVLVGADLLPVNKRYLDHESFVPRRLSTGAPIARTPVDDQILADTTTNYRVMNLPGFNSADPSYYHKTIGGYHAAKLTRYQDMIDRHLGHFLSNEQSDADWAVLNMLNARYIVDYSGQVLLNEETYGNAWFVDSLAYVKGPDAEMAALDRIDLRRAAVADESFRPVLGNASPKAPGDTIRLTTYAPNRLTYHTNSARGGVAVLSEVYFPWGWKAAVDGNPAEIGRVNYLLRAVKIPAGRHTLELTFDPPSVRNTETAATVAVILIYLLLGAACAAWLLRRRSTTTGNAV